MRRVSFWGSLGLATAVCISPAQAGWNEFWARFRKDTMRNSVYPEPFVTADREIVRSYWEQTEANGWRLQNTIGKYLFDETTQQLNSAGQQRIRWIMTNAPQHRRQIFVLRGDNQQISAQRMASVQEYLAQLGGEGNVPPVHFTDHDAPGISGQYIDGLEQQYQKTQPVPRLPSSSGGASSGSGGSSGASGS